MAAGHRGPHTASPGSGAAQQQNALHAADRPRRSSEPGTEPTRPGRHRAGQRCGGRLDRCAPARAAAAPGGALPHRRSGHGGDPASGSGSGRLAARCRPVAQQRNLERHGTAHQGGGQRHPAPVAGRSRPGHDPVGSAATGVAGGGHTPRQRRSREGRFGHALDAGGAGCAQRGTGGPGPAHHSHSGRQHQAPRAPVAPVTGRGRGSAGPAQWHGHPHGRGRLAGPQPWPDRRVRPHALDTGCGLRRLAQGSPPVERPVERGRSGPGLAHRRLGAAMAADPAGQCTGGAGSLAGVGRGSLGPPQAGAEPCRRPR